LGKKPDSGIFSVITLGPPPHAVKPTARNVAATIEIPRLILIFLPLKEIYGTEFQHLHLILDDKAINR
jgi:hypothetical protein